MFSVSSKEMLNPNHQYLSYYLKTDSLKMQLYQDEVTEVIIHWLGCLVEENKFK